MVQLSRESSSWSLATMTDVPSSSAFLMILQVGWYHLLKLRIGNLSANDWTWLDRGKPTQIMGSSTLLLPDTVVWRRCELQMRQRLFTHINAAFELINAFRIAGFLHGQIRFQMVWLDGRDLDRLFSHNWYFLFTVFEDMFQSQLWSLIESTSVKAVKEPK